MGDRNTITKARDTTSVMPNEAPKIVRLTAAT